MSKKTKKAMSMLLVVTLIAVIAVGGMLAYLTDRDSAANVFTVGDVDIELNEEFNQGSTLKPGVEIEKIPTVENTGKNNAWVWTTVAVPKALADVVEFIGTDAAWDWNTVAAKTEKIDNIDYTVYTVLHSAALDAGKETSAVFTAVKLSENIDITEAGKWYSINNGTATDLGWSNANGNPVIYVNAYAIQEEEFDTIDRAYAAYKGQWGTNGDAEYNNPIKEVDGTNKAALVAAINSAESGDVVQLTEDTTIAGYSAAEKLIIDKAVTIDLNGNTLTTESGWGGIDAKGGCSIINGTINHTGNTAAIKAFQVERIENVTINVTETAGKIKGGIVVQEGAGCYVGSIKNVTINGVTNGIETYRCGEREDLAIGSMENVTINATDTGIALSAPIGTLTNCNINGAKIGINAYLYGPYSVAADLVNCKVTGATGIYAHDEVGQTNPGSMTLTKDAATVINGAVTTEIEAEAAARVNIF